MKFEHHLECKEILTDCSSNAIFYLNLKTCNHSFGLGASKAVTKEKLGSLKKHT